MLGAYLKIKVKAGFYNGEKCELPRHDFLLVTVKCSCKYGTVVKVLAKTEGGCIHKLSIIRKKHSSRV